MTMIATAQTAEDTQPPTPPWRSGHALQPGERFSYFDSHGYPRVSGVVIKLDGDQLIGTREGHDGAWGMPAEHCIADAGPEPLDPTITDPRALPEGWPSAAVIALREQMDRYEGSGERPLYDQPREYRVLLELMMRQTTSDAAALAKMLPVTPCPTWCVDAGHHEWESEDPGVYSRDHRTTSALYGDGMELRWLESSGYPDAEPHIQVQPPALDYGDEDISIGNAAAFAAELLSLAKLAGGARCT